jgi:hypothetical protein
MNMYVPPQTALSSTSQLCINEYVPPFLQHYNEKDILA